MSCARGARSGADVRRDVLAVRVERASQLPPRHLRSIIASLKPGYQILAWRRARQPRTDGECGRAPVGDFEAPIAA